MDREVKLWAKTLLLAYPYLEKVAFLADRQLMSKAAGSWRAYGDAFDVCKGVIHPYQGQLYQRQVGHAGGMAHAECEIRQGHRAALF